MERLYFLGVDIAKNTFQAALTLDGINMFETEVENKAKPIRAYFAELKTKFQFKASQLIVCLEHTGIYSYPLLDYLVKAGVKVCVEPALQIKQSQGMKRGKSDKVDARRIAQYAVKNLHDLKFWKPQRSTIQKIQALLVVRDRLVKMKVQLETPLNETQEFIEESLRKMLVKNCQITLAALKKDLLKIEQTIRALIKSDSQVEQQFKWATSVPGIGPITALNVIVASGEFQRISESKKFACYAGIAPFEHMSGTSVRGKTRVSKMANMTVKKTLHLAALSAIQCSPELKAYYQRKVAEGKNRMSVINAVRNKLITRVFVCIKNQRTYEKVYQNALA